MDFADSPNTQILLLVIYIYIYIMFCLIAPTTHFHVFSLKKQTNSILTFFLSVLFFRNLVESIFAYISPQHKMDVCVFLLLASITPQTRKFKSHYTFVFYVIYFSVP